MQVREIMTRGADVIDPHTTIREAAKKMRADNVGALPVCDGERLLGMVALADLGRSDGEAAETALGGVSEPTDAPRR